MPSSRYLNILFKEIQQNHRAYAPGVLRTLYFGGGTPSLLAAEDIVSILSELAKFGFKTGPETEITIEINPATINPDKMRTYLQAGINRFSVGAQTFDDQLLRSVRREHTADQTRETLSLLKSLQVNYSFDILFALPGQSLAGLESDLKEVFRFSPPHVSPYCLTVPEGHVLSTKRLDEGLQLDMFHCISDFLENAGYTRYEISNFSKPGFESRHNMLYWDDSPYWGIGLSSHSFAHEHEWGVRYWNPSTIGAYEKLILDHGNREFARPADSLPPENKETLQAHQALTDFCHTSMRTMSGLSQDKLEKKFGPKITAQVLDQLDLLARQDLVTRYSEKSWHLTKQGLVLSNQVFASLTYLAQELRL